mmetsp:Transcript_31675/g.67305  ORF Transcript_31675/g.67305 Transcript_31675/m.67305 type:complete len:596 (-) Transcript_31675:70-1857(-)
MAAASASTCCLAACFFVVVEFLLPWRVAAELVPASELPLHTWGPNILGASGNRVRLACVNWYGAHLEQMVSNGLGGSSPTALALRAVELGFNCVRLPFSLDLVFGNRSQIPSPIACLAANLEFERLSPLDLFDVVVAALTAEGLLVILNNHVSSAKWCCSESDGEGLWYTDMYPERRWFEALRFMTARYRDDQFVVGFDLRNEIRASHIGEPTWGSGDPSTDWSIAAMRGGEVVLAEKPDMLVIISGLSFSSSLCSVPQRPVHFLSQALQGHTVYTAHEYPWFNGALLVRESIGLYLSTLALACGLLWLGVTVSIWLSWKHPVVARCKDWFVGDRHTGHLGFNGLHRAIFSTIIMLFLIWWDGLFPACDRSSARRMISLTLLCASGIASWSLWLQAAFVCARCAVIRCTCARTATLPGSRGEIEMSEKQTPLETETALPSLSPAHRSWHRLSAAFCSLHVCLLLGAFAVLGCLAGTWSEYGSYAAFKRDVDHRWGFLVQGEAAPEGDVTGGAATAPVWIGEFGTDRNSRWWRHMLRYIRERDLDWAYWSFNGLKTCVEQEEYGLLSGATLILRHSWKVKSLQALMSTRHVGEHVA